MSYSTIDKLISYKVAIDTNNIRYNTEYALDELIKSNKSLTDINSQLSDLANTNNLILKNQYIQIKHSEEQRYYKKIVFSFIDAFSFIDSLSDNELKYRLAKVLDIKSSVSLNISIDKLDNIEDKTKARNILNRINYINNSLSSIYIDTIFDKLDNALDEYKKYEKNIEYEIQLVSRRYNKLKDTDEILNDIERAKNVIKIEPKLINVLSKSNLKNTIVISYILATVGLFMLSVPIVGIPILFVSFILYKSSKSNLKKYETYVDDIKNNNDQEIIRVNTLNATSEDIAKKEIEQLEVKLTEYENINKEYQLNNHEINCKISELKCLLNKHEFFNIKDKIDSKYNKYYELMDKIVSLGEVEKTRSNLYGI